MPERWGALPLGELHPGNACALCGATRKLKSTTLRMTMARALICQDTVACERRRYQRRRRTW